MDDGKKNININDAVNALNKHSSNEDTQAVLTQIAKYRPSPIEEDKALRNMASKIGCSLKAIRMQYTMLCKSLGLRPNDIGYKIAQDLLSKHYDGGKLRLHPDGQFYAYDKTHWRTTTKANIRSQIQPIAAEYLHLVEKKTLMSLVSDAFRCLSDFLGTDQGITDMQETPPPVFNFQNGELWIDADGSYELRSHKPESLLFHCLSFDYDPSATAPKYEQALLGIFSETKDTEGMIRHWHETVGYAIQPTRFIAAFYIFIGHGRNGKTALLSTVQKLLSSTAVLNESINAFQKDRFNAAALHGKLLLIDDDMDSNVVLADGMLKKIQGSDFYPLAIYPSQRPDMIVALVSS